MKKRGIVMGQLPMLSMAWGRSLSQSGVCRKSVSSKRFHSAEKSSDFLHIHTVQAPSSCIGLFVVTLGFTELAPFADFQLSIPFLDRQTLWAKASEQPLRDGETQLRGKLCERARLRYWSKQTASSEGKVFRKH